MYVSAIRCTLIRAHARVLAAAKEHQWTAGIETYKKREALSTRGLPGWWALAILRSAKRAWALSIRPGKTATWALTRDTTVIASEILCTCPAYTCNYASDSIDQEAT